MSKGKESAFPIIVGDQLQTSGLSKRELFAAIMMQTSIMNSVQLNRETGNLGDHAQDAVDMADALLKHLAFKQSG